MFPLTRLAAIAIATAAFSVVSIAAPILQGTTTNPTGFTGLAVDGKTYDVTFTTQSYDTTFASLPPTFLGNESGGLSATFALVSALNAANVTELGDHSFPLGLPSVYAIYVPTEFFFDQGIFSAYEASLGSAFGSWLAFQTGGPSGRPGGVFGQTYDMFAVFSLPAVPEPSTIAMMGVGLGLVVLTRRRRWDLRRAP